MHVLLDRGLAGQAPAFTGLTAGEVGFLGGQHLATTAFDDALALGAGTAAATGGRQKHVIRRQGLQQFATGRHGKGALAVDDDIHVAAGYQLGACGEDDHHQSEDDGGEHANGQEDFKANHTWLLRVERR